MQIPSWFHIFDSVLPESVPQWPKTTWFGVGAACLGAVIAASGFSLLAWSSQQPMHQASAQEVAPESGSLGIIMVDVGGAVFQPGVYQLNTGDRWSQAVQAAGGILPQANTTFVSQQLNLAKSAQDGDKIYIPFADEILGDETLDDEALSDPSPRSPTDTISINHGTIQEFDTLPGIGAARAEAIIENRPYGSLEELVERKVLSRSIFDQIKGSLGL